MIVKRRAAALSTSSRRVIVRKKTVSRYYIFRLNMSASTKGKVRGLTPNKFYILDTKLGGRVAKGTNVVGYEKYEEAQAAAKRLKR
jgi:hypothetical protein